MIKDDIQLMQGDCLELMREIPDNSIDMVLCDLPYGITACKWDEVIPLDKLWDSYKRIVKPNGAIVLTSSQPFTTMLINSGLKQFKYEWIWEKSRSTGFLQSKFMPMKSHENICVFCFEGTPTFNPQKTKGHNPTNSAKGYGHSSTFGDSKERDYQGGDTERNPKTVLRFKSERGLHPTQKPVELMKYLIDTYSNPGETILDNCFGSATTAIACIKSGRKFIGIEKDKEYFLLGQDRINKEAKVIDDYDYLMTLFDFV